MKLSDMIVGKKYLVGDGLGYDIFICISHLNEKEIEEYFGYDERFKGVAVKVKNEYSYIDDVFFEADGCCSNLYIEPLN